MLSLSTHAGTFCKSIRMQMWKRALIFAVLIERSACSRYVEGLSGLVDAHTHARPEPCRMPAEMGEAFNETYVAKAVELVGGISVVSAARRRATVHMARAALLSDVRGDFVETGVYTGGTTALMALALRDFDACGRKMWAFDSFEGFPDDIREEDSSGGSNKGAAGEFSSPYETFVENMGIIGDAADRLVVTRGFFNETCAKSAVAEIALLRLDGDLYVSTWDALAALYDRVSPGGFVYVDDYGSFNGCREAVDRFRTERRIFEPMHFVQENTGPQPSFEAVWWRKL